MTGPGHNLALNQLESIIQRVERLNEDKKAIGDDIADIFKEANGNGFDVKTLKTVIKLRAMDPDKRAEQEVLLDTYKGVLGMS